MQIVIKIPDEDVPNKQEIIDIDLHFIAGEVCECTYPYIVLPKGHGDLIDIKDLRQDIIAHKYSTTFCEEHHIDQSINVGMLNILLADAPTIIEADKEEE